MKKIISVLLSIIACVTISACNGTDESTIPPTTPPSSETETPPNTPNGEENKGNIVTPIKPGGNYEIGDNYG